MGKRLLAVLAVFMISILAACSSGGTASSAPATESVAPTEAAPSEAPSESAAAEISGEITVLTNRTDIVETVFTAAYLPLFNAEYPGVTVKFEALTDYEGETKTRMNTEEYGDVLLIPNTITPDKLPEFFEPLGTIDELSESYNFVTEQSLAGQVYGLAVTGNANGFVYNKKVWDAAGVTSLPTTPEEFLADLTLIKDKTDAIPYYTNYKDGWPLTQWQSNRGQITDDPNFANGTLVHSDAPWSAGTDLGTIYTLLYDIVNQGLSEEDPTTTAWEPSKALIGSGEVATMQLGSWAMVQMQQAAVAAGGSADDIHYMPFPNQVNGSFVSNIGGDYKIGINVHSENKAAARAWIDWFVNESNFAFDQGGVSPVKGGANPPQLADFDAVGVKYIEQLPPAEGEEGLLGKIQDASEIQLFDQTWVQRIVDAARGATDESLDTIFNDLNTKWAAARASVGVN